MAEHLACQQFDEHKEKLIGRMEELTKDNVLVAFSGGVDSSLLLGLAVEKSRINGTKAIAVMANTTMHPVREAEEAERTAAETGAEFYIIELDELGGRNEHNTEQKHGIKHKFVSEEEGGAGIEDNPVDRCYRCKRYMFSRLKEWGSEHGINTVIEGTNADDLKVYRPGIKAIRELSVISPLAEAEMSKEEVRTFAREMGISVSDKPSTPCMATRFPYGTHLTTEGMRNVSKAEEYMSSMGFYNVRVRVHGELARIEVDLESLGKLLEYRSQVIALMKGLGYQYITLDLQGFRSGSMDIGK